MNNNASSVFLSFCFLCSCSIGYTGSHCAVEINECSSAPCHNGGTCVDQIGKYACTCPVGYTGSVCDVDIDDCSPTPCLNQGSCTDLVSTCTHILHIGDSIELMHAHLPPPPPPPLPHTHTHMHKHPSSTSLQSGHRPSSWKVLAIIALHQKTTQIHNIHT